MSRYSSTLKYKCNVCKHSMRGCDLPRHYKNMTNWSDFAKLKQCVGDTEVEAQLAKVDPHTAFMFRNNYKENNLLTWRSHKLWKNPEAAAGPAGVMKTMKDFFLRKTSTNSGISGSPVSSSNRSRSRSRSARSRSSRSRSRSSHRSRSRSRSRNPSLSLTSERRSRSRSLTSVRSVTVGDDSEVVEDDRLHGEEATDDR